MLHGIFGINVIRPSVFWPSVTDLL